MTPARVPVRAMVGDCERSIEEPPEPVVAAPGLGEAEVEHLHLAVGGEIRPPSPLPPVRKHESATPPAGPGCKWTATLCGWNWRDCSALGRGRNPPGRCSARWLAPPTGPRLSSSQTLPVVSVSGTTRAGRRHGELRAAAGRERPAGGVVVRHPEGLPVWPSGRRPPSCQLPGGGPRRPCRRLRRTSLHSHLPSFRFAEGGRCSSNVTVTSPEPSAAARPAGWSTRPIFV